MEKELGSDVIKATQDALGKYVKRPPLTEKLLRKPPFRFLHDIITAVLKTTGFFEGLFDENELVSENVKDRESKISFLSKVISVLSLTTGKTLSAKPSKIVAGQEPEKTNELLQCLALALDKKLSSEEAIKTVKGTKVLPQTLQIPTKDIKKGGRNNNDAKQFAKKSSEKPTSRRYPREKSKSEKEKITEDKSRKRENEQVKLKKTQLTKTSNNEEQSSQQLKGPKINLVHKNKAEPKDGEILEKNSESIVITENNDEIIFDENERLLANVPILLNEKKDLTIEPNDEQYEDENLNSLTLPDSGINLTSSIHNTDITRSTIELEVSKQENVLRNHNLPIENKQPLTFNIGSTQSNVEQTKIFADNNSVLQAQPSNPPVNLSSEVTSSTMVNQNNKTVTRPLSVRPSSSRPGAPRLREKLDNFISEPNNVLIGKVHIITETNGNEEEEEGNLVIVETQESEAQSSTDLQEHGHLVQQILDSQKQLSLVNGKTEIEWQFGVQKSKEAQHQEIEQLTFNIQAVSRAANPLGKLLDHIQEDVEVMRQELQQWNNIYDGVSKEISKQKSLNEDSLQPLRAKLKQLEIETEEKIDKICDMKILIHKNTIRIEKLLSGGTVQ